MTSPVDGVAGLVHPVQVGDLVGPGTKGFSPPYPSLDPTKAPYFPISEQSYLEFEKEHPEADGSSRRRSALELDPRLTASVYPSAGKILRASIGKSIPIPGPSRSRLCFQTRRTSFVQDNTDVCGR